MNTHEKFVDLLRNETPSSHLINQVFARLTSTQELWTTCGSENEATFLKNMFVPCLDATFGALKHTSSRWTSALEETRDPAARLLFPDYSVVIQIGTQTCSIVHLECKTASNKGLSQIWDDLTELGQELKHSLDTMVKLQPAGPVCALGILVKGFHIQFYVMNIKSEGVYILRKYAECLIFNKADNLFPLGRLLEILETTKKRPNHT
ncbi:hypothetical protein BGZ58_006789 [Dissophora ornata]|nr:hypothetical protein BGZ58_006789 [Dissophora ornata]